MAAFRTVVLLLFVALSAEAQVNRYMVFFRDKNDTPYTTDQPELFLSQKSIDRRTKQSIPTLTEDLPVNPAYINQVKSAGGKTYFTSRWRNAVLTEIHQDTVTLIGALACVASVELVAPGNKFSGGRIRKLRNKFSTSSANAIASLPQLQQLEIDQMHKAGYHGENLAIAVLDGGFAAVNTAIPFQALVQRGGIKQSFNFVTRSADVYPNCSDCSHGTQVLSTMAVNTADYTGAAWAADYYLYVTEDNPTEYRVEEYNWLFAAEKADSAGVDIITSSLGYNTFDDEAMDYTKTDMDGKTSAIAKAAAIALSKGMVIAISAGNSGNDSWHIIETPADVNGVLAVGAVTVDGELAVFSSVGPSADGRTKPDVVAMGSGSSVVLSTGALGSNSGTSFSCPLVAGLAAGVWQAFPFLSAGQVYKAVIHSADRASSPDNRFGFGIPKFTKVKDYIEASNVTSVYPNPYESGKAYAPADLNKVKINFTYGVGETAITVYDTFGRMMLQGSYTIASENSILSFDIASLPSAVYFIRIRNSFTNTTVRFVKA